MEKTRKTPEPKQEKNNSFRTQNYNTEKGANNIIIENKQLYHFEMKVVREESMRYLKESKITDPDKLYEIFRSLFSLSDILISEKFYIMYLDNSNSLIGTSLISFGGMTGTCVDIRVILRGALLMGATAIVLAHNHPSGKLTPSDEDKELTKSIEEACKLIDITVLDHLIITENEYLSFSIEGLL